MKCVFGKLSTPLKSKVTLIDQSCQQPRPLVIPLSFSTLSKPLTDKFIYASLEILIECLKDEYTFLLVKGSV
jgi:hypothetical protein